MAICRKARWSSQVAPLLPALGSGSSRAGQAGSVVRLWLLLYRVFLPGDMASSGNPQTGEVPTGLCWLLLFSLVFWVDGFAFTVISILTSEKNCVCCNREGWEWYRCSVYVPDSQKISKCVCSSCASVHVCTGLCVCRSEDNPGVIIRNAVNLLRDGVSHWPAAHQWCQACSPTAGEWARCWGLSSPVCFQVEQCFTDKTFFQHFAQDFNRQSNCNLSISSQCAQAATHLYLHV